jgi:ATP-dependent Clp protease ATP-binding subunit ClpX
MAKNNSASVTCICCGIPLDPEKSFVFNFNDEPCYFCDSHAHPFKMGISIGQLEINAKFISFISNLSDPVSKQDLNKSLLQLAPLTKLNLPTPGVDESEEKEKVEYKFNTPKELYGLIDQKVVGQELAKKTMSVAMVNHLKSLDDDEDYNPTHSDKQHVLFLGKSGSGKTLLVKTAAAECHLPFAIGDSTNYSPAGFQGSDVDTVVYDLLLSTDMDFDLAQRGIVFIDEIDKISCSNKNAGRYESFIGSTQATLLKLVEGKVVKIPGPIFGEPPGSFANLDTSKMLFVFGGAFNGLAEIIAKKKGLTDKVMGFRPNANKKMEELDEAIKSYEIFSQASREELVDSLIEFGMLAELLGRIPTIVPLKPLGKEELLAVLMGSEISPIIKQKEIFEKSGYELIFTDDFLNEIVEKSYKSATGTRALDSYVKNSVSIASFDCLNLDKSSHNKEQIVISKECIDDPSKYQKYTLFTNFTNAKIIEVPSSMSTTAVITI